MAKSIRSKFKKKQRALKSQKLAPVVEARVAKLNGKLALCSKGGLSKIPMQDPPAHFGFKNPQVAKGQRLKLDPMTTNAHGLTDPSRPHSQVRLHANYVDADTPQAGTAITKEMIERMRAKSDVALEDDVFLINNKVVSTSSGRALQAKDFMGMVEVMSDSDDENVAAAIEDDEGEVVADEEDVAPAPQKLKSMQLQKGETSGNVKIKSDRKRLVSGTKKGAHAKRK